MAAPITRGVTLESCKKVLRPVKQRGFTESIELQVGLKDYDPQRDKRFAGSVVLKNPVAAKRTVCVLGDDSACEKAKQAGLPYMDLSAMKAMNKNAKVIKKVVASYDAFLASQTVIGQLTKFFGPALNKAGKFPTVFGPYDNLQQKVEDLRATVKFQLKKSLSLGVVVGSMGINEEDLADNVMSALNFLASLTKKGHYNFKSVTIKSTMGKPERIYG